jgi:hypothetical protein
MRTVGTRFKHVMSGVAFSLLLATASSGSVPNTDATTLPLKGVFEWIQHTGRPSVIRARILKPMDLPSARDMPVRERGFRHEGERITHVCSTSAVPELKSLMFFAQVDESNGRAVVWRTTLDGRIVGTVAFDGVTVERVPNERFRTGFETEKLFFVTRMRLELPLASPSPAGSATTHSPHN